MTKNYGTNGNSAKRLSEALFFKFPLRLSRALLAGGQPRTALWVANIAGKYRKKNVDVLEVKSKAYRDMGYLEKSRLLGKQRLVYGSSHFERIEDFPNILRLIAEREQDKKSVSFKIGSLVARQLETEGGREDLLAAASESLQDYENSPFLLQLITLCRAMKDEYREAGALLMERLTKNSGNLGRREFVTLRDSWRVVDLVARENMDWLNEQGQYADLLKGIFEKESPQDDDDNPLGFKEHALEGRLRDEYLRACEKEFYEASNLTQRLAAITQMLRTGIRHMPEYKRTYALARDKFAMVEPEISMLTSKFPPYGPKAAQTIIDICRAIHLCDHLGFGEVKRRYADYLVELSDLDSFGQMLWPAAAELSRNADDIETANLIMRRIKHNTPKTERDVRFVFRWAINTGEYHEAERFLQSKGRKVISRDLRRKDPMLFYVNILQRLGRFKEARSLAREVHGQMIAQPHRTNPFSSFKLLKRIGELDFLVKTANIYSSVPQPQAPVGVVLIAPRNVDHLRRYPLMVLLELKRRGWAVVPMVEGLLPKELTGIPEIDVMNCAIQPTTRLSSRAEKVIPEVDDFICDPGNRLMRWGTIDLSHSLWEDAAINRRRYSIDYGCPELQRYLGGLGSWTRSIARILSFAQTVQRSRSDDLRIACVSLFNHRLPDSLFRAYCEQFGDSERFFFLHAANGYQNYFTNFSTNISQRFVLRNITKASEVRSASFPIPENFERYYRERAGDAPAILEQFESVTKITRSTGSNKERPAEAEEMRARILAWREAGGRVACAFGKVVCDSGVPFDGGPAHASMKDWINHSIRAVQGSNTLLLIKPHPHELNNQISTFPTEYFADLIDEHFGGNAVMLEHHWYDIHDMKDLVDIGVIYNGTTAVELGVLGIPCILCGHFAPIDYPVGHAVPQDRREFEAFLRFERPLNVAADIKERSAMWLDYMSNDHFTQSYRYHVRPVTNKVLYPPWWFEEDLERYAEEGDSAIDELAGRATGDRPEPGGLNSGTSFSLPPLSIDFTRRKGDGANETDDDGEDLGSGDEARRADIRR